MKTLSAKGIKALGQREGREARAYKDTKGLWTIGVGHLVQANEMERLVGTPQMIGGRLRGSVVLTDREIDDLARVDFDRFIRRVNIELQVPVTQNQFDSLVSLAFNIGEGGFAGSTLLRKINANAPPNEINDAFRMWNKPPEIRGRRETEVRQYWEHLSTFVIIALIAAAILFACAGVASIA